MVDKHILDNLNGQEIKEMINDKKLDIDNLDSVALRKLMDYEIDMICVGKGDTELVCRCSDRLDQIDPNPMTDEQFMSIIEKSKAENIDIVDEKPKVRNVYKARVIIKRIAIVAAVVVLLMAGTVAVAGAFDVDILKVLDKMKTAPAGTKYEIGDFTFIIGGGEEYDSIEEMLEEYPDIMYPTKWPDGIYVKGIQKTKSARNNDMVQISTNYFDVNVYIEFTDQPLITSIEEILEYNGILFYIENYEGYHAYCFHESKIYYIAATSREELMLIIENLKYN